jgi:cyanophycinase
MIGLDASAVKDEINRIGEMMRCSQSERPLRWTRALIACAALGITTSSCAWAQTTRAASTSAPRHAGTLFIVGGGPQSAALVREFVDLAGGAGKARIVVFAMASSDGLASGEDKAKDLRDLGASAVNIFVNSQQANTDSIARMLDGVTGVWFGGGDQVLLTKALRGTKTEQAIHARYDAGAVIGGTSAGAAVMSARMITGDERHPGGARPPKDSADAFMTIARDDIVIDPGFGFLTNAVVDQHFLRRKRHNRLISVVLEQPEHLGVGIDESTALVVEPDGRWRVAGASAATVFDGRRAKITPTGATLGAAGIVMHVLPAGSRFDPRTGVATLPAAPATRQ